jgi:hypothetical protein
MMKKVQIVNETLQDNTIQLTEIDLIFLIKAHGLEHVLTNYELPEDFILKWGPGDSEFGGIDKRIVMSVLSLSQEFIYAALTSEYFLIEDIRELNMRTYSNLDPNFIEEFSEYINWERMILYLSSSDKIENIENLSWIIDKFNLWNLISANELPIEFIRKNKEKFDWRILSIVNCFTEEQKEEFGEFIPKISNLEISEIKTPNLKEIRQMIKAQVKTLTSNSQEKSRFDVKHSSERLTRDDLFRIKQTIQEAESKRGI